MEDIDTSGFYKKEDEQLLCGPNFVINQNFELYKETKDQYKYPVEGWYWFDTEKEAKQFFNL